MKDQPAGLMFDQPLEQPAILGRQLPVFDADVAQKHDVVIRQARPSPLGNCLM